MEPWASVWTIGSALRPRDELRRDSCEDAGVPSTGDRYARGFSDMADVYVGLGHRAEPLIRLADPQPGDRVLDVGCGPATATTMAAEVVGPDGQVVGVDLAVGMLDRAAAVIAGRPDQVISLARMDARTLAFPDAIFDVVIANSVLQFTRSGSLSEWRRVVRPGGRVACSLPHGPVLMTELFEAFIDRTAEPYRSTMRPRLAGAGSPPDPERARRSAGFDSVEATVDTFVRRHASPEEAFEAEYRHGARVFLEELPPDALDEFRAAYLEKVATSDGRAELPMAFHYWCFS
jgi:ubiquinone/menaquinone biosynthesis C-methylase UbiE